MNTKMTLGSFLGLAATVSTVAASAQKPNIVLFMVDDMGWQDTSVPFDTAVSAWNKIYHTPSMERLAQKGVKFTNAYATAVSTPSRVSLMTGMNTASHRVTNWTYDRGTFSDGRSDRLKPPAWNVNGLQPAGTGMEQAIEATTLPELLRAAGYTTIHCGKAHFAAMGTPGEDPTKLGFMVNIAGNGAGHPASYLGENNYGNIPGAAKKNRNAVVGLEKYWGRKDMFLTEALTIEALAAVDSVRSVTPDKPFFLYLSHYAVHTPFNIDPRFYQKYLDRGLPHSDAMYAGLIEGMDKSLGDVLDYLDAQGIANNTIVVFMSDNGGLSVAGYRAKGQSRYNWPLRSGKGSALEGGSREPMIVYHPQITRVRSVEDTPVHVMDFLPTLADMAGIRKPKTIQHIDGQSFLPLLHGKKYVAPSYVWHYPNIWGPSGEGIGAYSSIRRGAMKYIWFYEDGRAELYDLAHDLSETNNLAEQPTYAAERQQLARELTRYLKDKKAQLPSFKESGILCSYPE